MSGGPSSCRLFAGTEWKIASFGRESLLGARVTIGHGKTLTATVALPATGTTYIHTEGESDPHQFSAERPSVE
jgi:hypothetical protein